ncbi:MAG: SlyX family protein [Spirochaetia bacterium]|nr:SlyX family protein [Spirochaetia bacterium]
MDTETENRFITLETKLAFMDDFVNKLQQEVVKQHKVIEILREENKILSSRIMDLSENIEIPNRKPPHY